MDSYEGVLPRISSRREEAAQWKTLFDGFIAGFINGFGMVKPQRQSRSKRRSRRKPARERLTREWTGKFREIVRELDCIFRSEIFEPSLSETSPSSEEHESSEITPEIETDMESNSDTEESQKSQDAIAT